MSDVPAMLLPFVFGVPCVGAVVAWIGARHGVPHWFAALCCGIGSACAGAGLVIGHLIPDAAATSLGPVEWLGVGMEVRLGLRFDALAWAWSFCVLSAATLLLAGAGIDGARRSRFALLVTVAATATIGGVAGTSLVQILLCGGVASLTVFLAAGAMDERGTIGVLARRVLLHQVLGDGLLLLGLLLAAGTLAGDVGLDVASYAVGDDTAIAAHLDEEGLRAAFPDDRTRRSELAARRASVSLFGFALLGCVVARCAGFPFFGWSRDAGRLPPAVAGLALSIVAPCAAILLVRCDGVLAVSGDVRSTGLLVGALTSVLAGLSAAGQSEPRAALGLATASLLGVVAAGLCTEGGATGAVVMLLALVPLSAAVWAGQRGECWSRVGRRSAVVVGVLLLAGPFGMNAIVHEVFRAPRDPGIVIGCVMLAGLALSAFACVRAFAQLDGIDDDDRIIVQPAEANAGPAWLPLAIGGVAAGFAWLLYDGWLPFDTTTNGTTAGEPVLGLGLATLATTTGGVLGWTLREVDLAPRLGALGRIGLHCFYLPAVVELLVVMPVRAIAQIARFVDWFVLDGLVTGVPKRLLRLADGSTTAVRNAGVSVALLWALLALGGLATALLWW